jgi:hypothetical protein
VTTAVEAASCWAVNTMQATYRLAKRDQLRDQLRDQEEAAS